MRPTPCVIFNSLNARFRVPAPVLRLQNSHGGRHCRAGLWLPLDRQCKTHQNPHRTQPQPHPSALRSLASTSRSRRRNPKGLNFVWSPRLPISTRVFRHGHHRLDSYHLNLKRQWRPSTQSWPQLSSPVLLPSTFNAASVVPTGSTSPTAASAGSRSALALAALTRRVQGMADGKWLALLVTDTQATFAVHGNRESFWIQAVQVKPLEVAFT